MGIQVWQSRYAPAGVELPEPVTEVTSALDRNERERIPANESSDGLVSAAAGASSERQILPIAAPNPIAACGWDELAARVAGCTACPLHAGRTQTVFGVGDRTARWMIIGEAPGEQEDLQGEPFVGRAGLLLNEMLRAVGLQREQVYIANVLKCRPPKNRDPQAEEAAACEDYLKRQLALVHPDIILAVGRIAAQNLLKTATPIGKLRGAVHDYQGVPLVVTYHPAYLLRSPLEKRRAWDDLKLARAIFRRRQP
ncbi:uracil-DNA glycosylase family protein [Methylococcus sp. EFPC2]|uniref:uracil-DNA glycosylase n=1 Tax=Methylococcus sp. EFPC2 TaxID=2812648 RepID=UPI001F0815EC|nr:uracil-DNA glycosylase [Methylococcus sp. EFPC2]